MSDIGRRQFLGKVLSGAAVLGAAQVGIELAAPRKVSAQTNMTPDAVMRELLAGNQRFVTNQMTSWEHDLVILKEKTSEKQEPFAAVLSCADSRVPVELVFDQTIGHIFVTRVAGNIVTPEIMASLEFGVAVLGVKALLVLGHDACGAVKAAMTANAVPGQISVLYQHLHPVVMRSGGDVDKAVDDNARYQAGLLRTSSPVIKDAIKAGKLKVEAASYDLATGKVDMLAQ